MKRWKYGVFLDNSQVMSHASSLLLTLQGFQKTPSICVPYPAALNLFYLQIFFKMNLHHLSLSLSTSFILSCPPLLLRQPQLIHEQHHDWILIIHISSPWWLITTLQMEREGEGDGHTQMKIWRCTQTLTCINIYIYILYTQRYIQKISKV